MLAIAILIFGVLIPIAIGIIIGRLDTRPRRIVAIGLLVALAYYALLRVAIAIMYSISAV